jgi:hypothetical protein
MSLRPMIVVEPNVGNGIGGVNRRNAMRVTRSLYTVAYPLAAVMLAAWAYVTFFGPGWGVMHLFLTLGVSLIIWRIVSSDRPPTA